MKNIPLRTSIVFALLLPLVAGLLVPAQAGCRYFRSDATVLKCKEVNPAELQDLSRDETVVPEDPATPDGKLMRVRCNCEYKLSGANPFCDLDQTQELASVLGTDNAVTPCAGAKTFCDHLCPQTLN